MPETVTPMNGNQGESLPNWVGRSLDYCYDLALNSTLGGTQKTCYQLAEDYQRQGRSPDKAINNLITWQCGKTGLSGFVAGLPGFLALPGTSCADRFTWQPADRPPRLQEGCGLRGKHLPGAERRTFCAALITPPASPGPPEPTGFRHTTGRTLGTCAPRCAYSPGSPTAD